MTSTGQVVGMTVIPQGRNIVRPRSPPQRARHTGGRRAAACLRLRGAVTETLPELNSLSAAFPGFAGKGPRCEFCHAHRHGHAGAGAHPTVLVACTFCRPKADPPKVSASFPPHLCLQVVPQLIAYGEVKTPVQDPVDTTTPQLAVRKR